MHALTGLRFIAALHVVLLHVCGSNLTAGSYFLTNILRSGFVAVELFFALSGFVLIYSYADREYTKREFYIARWARIYPLYAIALLLSLPNFYREAQAGSSSTAPVIASLLTVPLLLQAWFPSTALNWNSPAWSLSVEAVFYILFPYLAKYLKKIPIGQLGAGFLAVWLLSCLPPGIYLATNPDGVGWIGILVDAPAIARADTHGWLGVVHFNPLVHIPEFVAGALTGVLFLNRRAAAPSETGSLWGMTLASCALGAGILGLLAFADRIPVLLLGNGLLLPLFCALIYTLAINHDYLSRFLSFPIMILLGEASYGIYILQIPVRTIFRAAWQVITGTKLPAEMTSWTAVLIYILFLAVICIAAHFLIERPLQLRIRGAVRVPVIT